jgi:hypothetical protein
VTGRRRNFVDGTSSTTPHREMPECNLTAGECPPPSRVVADAERIRITLYLGADDFTARPEL